MSIVIPEEYWIVETDQARIIVTEHMADVARDAIQKRLALIDLVDVFDCPIWMVPREIAIIYKSDREVRRLAREHGFMLELENRADRSNYFMEHGLVDPGL